MESDNQNSPKRNWSHLANEIRERYLDYITRKRGLKFAKQWKVYLIIMGGFFVVASPILFVIGMFEVPDQSDNIAIRLLASVVLFLLFFLPGVLAIYTGLGKIFDPLEEEESRTESPVKRDDAPSS